MRYYKQFHSWPNSYFIPVILGCVCFYYAVAWRDITERLGILICAILSLIAAWIIWKDRDHYLDIDQDWIVHQGFKRWQIRRADVMRVEYGKKRWADDHDAYLTVHACGREYRVEDGFLIDDKRIGELAGAMQKPMATGNLNISLKNK